MVVKKTETPVQLMQFSRKTIEVPIIGENSLIVHKWSEKAKQMIKDKQAGKATSRKREARDPDADYESSLYRIDDARVGFPATGFKGAMVGAARIFDNMKMTHLKVAVRVEEDDLNTGLVEIHGDLKKREDMVRLETGVADIRYRYEIQNWWAILRVTYVSNMLTEEQVVNLINGAGMGGVGEWRPSAPKSLTGQYGIFRVATPEELEAAIKRTS